MPIKLPNLDDLRWQDLNEEALSLIPATAPGWTNFNPTDPGITLSEMFAYVCERLMYQIDRVGDRNVLEFLMLIHGAAWKRQKESLEKKEPVERRKRLVEEMRAAVRQLERPSRAVTAADFEQLAGAVPNVARAKCIPRLNLEDPEAASRATPAPGHVSIVILPQSGSEAAPELVHRVRQALESARLLTTRLHVVLPRFLKMSVHVTIGAGRGAHPETLREEASRRIQLLFHPLNGGLDGKGWPLGRKVHVSDIYAVLADLPGIDFVAPVRTPNGALMEELALASPDASRLKRNPRGELEAIELRRDEFVEIEIGRGDIVLASRP